MTYSTIAPITPQATVGVVASTLTAIRQLTTDDQLGLLWTLYKNMGRAITPAAPVAARLQFAEGLLEQVKAMPHTLQLQFMRNLIENTKTLPKPVLTGC